MNLTLFDLDGTLLPGDSDHAFGEFLVSLGWADAALFKRRNDAFYADYQAGTLNIHDYVDFCTAPWRDRDEPSLARLQQDFMQQRARPMLMPAARQLVQRHQEAGDLVAVVTATNDFITRPIALELGVSSLLATELQRNAQGRVTGKIEGTPAFREGKIVRVGEWLAQQGLDWPALHSSTFYSDSTNDLPLLERVSHPVATNPTPALQAIALQRGWPILKLFE